MKGKAMPEGLIDGQEYEFPHCNAETLHAPGECYYCDHYPDRQAARRRTGQAFTPNEANGWSGDVAVKAGQTHEHMGARFTVGGSIGARVRRSVARRLLNRFFG